MAGVDDQTLKPFFNVRYFDKATLEQAWRWVMDKGPRSTPRVKEGQHTLGIFPGPTNCQ